MLPTLDLAAVKYIHAYMQKHKTHTQANYHTCIGHILLTLDASVNMSTSTSVEFEADAYAGR
jgi:hypothetical protein